MRALLFREIGSIDMVDIAEPEPAEGEILVEVAVAGLCGSDIHAVRDGGLLRTPPIVMGHEFSGTVGDRRVVVYPIISCGDCDLCTTGLDHLCRQRSIIGIQRPGGFASRVAVPSETLIDLPKGVSMEAAALIEPLAVALHAIRLHQPAPGTKVGVLGAGTIGLFVTLLCNDLTDHLHVADPQTDRIAHADQMGATSVGPDLVGEFDIIFDAVGNSTSHRSSLDHLRPGGVAVWIGNESHEPSFDAQALVRMQHSVLGSAAYTRGDFETAASRVDERALALAQVRPLEEAPELIRQSIRGQGEAIKLLLRPDGEVRN